ncbi:MAG: hypothetical protein LBU44_02685 [Mediterranea sp.]|jgi:hypothetical protein|nr:hypothetical protein [Mediterranea sp.]
MKAKQLLPTSFEQNLKRKVVFTMNTNEVIYENNYFLCQTLNQKRFAYVAHDTVTGEYTFVFNGERIRTAPNYGDLYDDEWDLYYVNPGEEKGYVFKYRENGRWYINYYGVTDGGFDDVCYHFLFSDDEERYTPEKDYDYLYKLADKWYACKNGRKKEISFIEGVYKDEDGEYYVNVNGSISGPYEDINDLALTESGKYAYSYGNNNGKYYVNVNGFTVGGPYEAIFYDSLIFTESGKYAYSYYDNEKWYVNVNGTIVGGPYGEKIYSFTLTESGKYAYFYLNNGKWYVNVNGSTVGGPYDCEFYDIRLVLTESGKYAYSCYDNEKGYVNVNGSIVGGPYEKEIFDLTLTENGEYSYYYHENRKYYRNTNGVVTEEQDNQFLNYHYSQDNLNLTSKDGKHSFSSSYEHEYVVIDGRSYGRSPAVEAWYDASKNAFLWSAVEDRELVVYEYALR